MYCSKCGEKLTAKDKFCSKCGTVVEEENKTAKTVVVEETQVVTLPEAYRPISTWGYIGWMLLFNCIPCVNWIIVIIFACGVSENKNVTNLARAHLILWLIFTILIVLFYILLFVIFAASYSTPSYYYY